MNSDLNLNINEELDFHYLLGLMPPMHDVPEYAMLPELFSLLGHDKLLLLCKYAGGEIVKIPTLDQLTRSIEAIQWFYDVNISKRKLFDEVPSSIRVLYEKIVEEYRAQGAI